MTCQQAQERMIDVLYGEDVDSRFCFEFFRHLGSCQRCNDEYLELIETREMLAKWQIEAPEPAGIEEERSKFLPSRYTRARGWGAALQKVAAAILILVGIVSILQYMGFLGGRHLVVSERQLGRLVEDTVAAHQVRERELMLEAMLRVKEDVELQQRAEFNQLRQYLISLEERYVENLEENNQYLRVLLSR